MNNFYFGIPSDDDGDLLNGESSSVSTSYHTFRKSETMDERNFILYNVEKEMGGMVYMVKACDEFDYEYINEANRIRRMFRGWAVIVDYVQNREKKRNKYIIRFLDSPYYEIEMQKEYDYKEMQRIKEMHVKEVEKTKEAAPLVKQKARQKTDAELVESFQKAKLMSEQNASVPSTISREYGPMTIEVASDDTVKKDMKRKDEIDKKKKDDEMRLMSSFLRNKEKLRAAKT